MKTRILSLIFAILMALTVLTIPAAAATAAAPSSALAFLDDFLSNLQKGNTEKAFCAMDDTRHVLNENVSFSNLTAPEKAYISRIENGQAFKDMYDKDPIKDYKILEETSNGVILTHLYFKDGSEAIVPFRVESNGSSFKVLITTDDIESLGYEQLKNVTSESANPVPTSSNKDDPLDDYSFSYLYGTIYGQDTFSVSKNAIRIDGYQANDMLESGWLSEAEVIYSVIKERWYGDDVWASTTNAIVKNGTFSITIIGKSSSASDLKIRIENQTGSNPRSKGYGELYSVTN